MMERKIKSAAIAWILLSTRKARQVGDEPYPFVPSYKKGVVIECDAGWQDEGHWGDGGMEYDSSQEDKLDFIRAFKSLYPRGAAVYLR
jgi:hypothetical protein